MRRLSMGLAFLVAVGTAALGARLECLEQSAVSSN